VGKKKEKRREAGWATKRDHLQNQECHAISSFYKKRRTKGTGGGGKATSVPKWEEKRREERGERTSPRGERNLAIKEKQLGMTRLKNKVKRKRSGM